MQLKVAEVSDVTTVPSFRGRGLASALLTWTLCELKHMGVEYAELQAVRDASEIYRKIGFEENTEMEIWEHVYRQKLEESAE